MLTACLFITHFPARCERQRQRARADDALSHGRSRPRTKPIIVFDSGTANPAVIDCTPEVRAKPGDSLAGARARCPDARVVKEDRDHYRAQWNKVLHGLMQVSDRVEDALIGCAYVALDGLQAMYGGLDNVIDAVMSVPPDWLPPRLGVAHGKFHARCAAITGASGVPNIMPADADAARQAVAAMPLRMLPLTSRQVLMLHDFGILTIGDLARQPLSAIQAQLGFPGKRAWELANGIDDAPLIGQEHSETVTQRMQFHWPVVSIDALNFGIFAVMQDAFNSPVRGSRSVGRTDVLLQMEDHPDWSLSRTFKEPVGDASKAAQVVMDAIIAALNREPSPMQGPISAIHVALTKLGTPRAEQSALWSEERAGDLHTSLRQLAMRDNMPALTKVVDVEPWSRIPERRQALAPVTSL